jgi:hypothetical protein
MFCSEYKYRLVLLTLNVYCVYTPLSKCPKQLQNVLKNAEVSVVPINFKGVFYHVCAYTVLVSYRSLYMNHEPEKIYFEHFLYIANFMQSMAFDCSNKTSVLSYIFSNNNRDMKYYRWFQRVILRCYSDVALSNLDKRTIVFLEMDFSLHGTLRLRCDIIF